MLFHHQVLTAGQKRVLQQLGPIVSQKRFYLAGGTALAIQLGHRRSTDLDWFTPQPMGDVMPLASLIKERGIPFRIHQVEKGTLHGTAWGVRISFFEYRYPLLQKKIAGGEFGCRLASLPDIAAMKLSAIAQRGSKKDFLDLYALGVRGFSLKDLILFYKRKFSIEDVGHLLYALSYFDDAQKERMPVMLWKTDWKAVKGTIQEWVKAFVSQGN